MIVVDPSTLSVRDREALTRVLAERAPLEHVAPRRTNAEIAGMFGVGIALAILGSFPAPRLFAAEPTRLVLAFWAAAAGCIGLAIHWLVRRRALARCPWRCGLFLHRFGVFQAEPRWVRYVPGEELDEPRFVARPTLGVRLASQRWSVTLPAAEPAWESLYELMDGLPFRRWTRCDGYRASGAPLDHARPYGLAITDAVKRAVTTLSFAALGAFFAWLVVVPELVLARTPREGYGAELALRSFEADYDRPWTHDRTHRALEQLLRVQRHDREVLLQGRRARIRERVPEPFRTELLALLPDDIDEGESLLEMGSHSRCNPRSFLQTLEPTPGASHEEHEAFRTFESWNVSRYSDPFRLSPLGDFGASHGSPERYARSGSFDVACTFHAQGGDLLRRVRARITTNVTLTLAVRGREPVSRQISIGDDDELLFTYERWWSATSDRIDTETWTILTGRSPD